MSTDHATKINFRQHRVIMSYIRLGKHLEGGFYQGPTESKEVQKLTHEEAKLYIASLSGKPAPEGFAQEESVDAEMPEQGPATAAESTTPPEKESAMSDYPRLINYDAQNDDDPETTTINLGDYPVNFEDILLDPEGLFTNLTEKQEEEMQAEYILAWENAVNEVLAPIRGQIIPATSLIIGPLASAGMLTEEIMEAIAMANADEDGTLWRKWNAINEAQA